MRIALVPEGSDPDDLVRTSGPSALQEVLDRAQPAVEYFIHQVWSGDDHSAHTRSEAVREAAWVLKTIPDATQRDFAVGTLATAWGVDESTLRKGLRRALTEGSPDQPSGAPKTPDLDRNPSKPKVSAPDPLELDILAILTEYPQLMASARKLDVNACLTDSRLRSMYDNIAHADEPTSFGSTTAALASAADPELEKVLAKHVFDGAYRSVPEPEACLHQAVTRLRHSQAKHKLTQLQELAQKANRDGDSELERQLFRQILETRKQVD